MTRNETRELVRCSRCNNEYAAFGLATLPQCPRCGGALITVDAPASAPAEPGGEPMTIDAALFALEEAMDHFMDHPLQGDRMSLTRAWRDILDRLRTPSPGAATRGEP